MQPNDLIMAFQPSFLQIMHIHVDHMQLPTLASDDFSQELLWLRLAAHGLDPLCTYPHGVLGHR